MKKFILSLAAILVMAFGAQAQLLWRVSGNGSKGQSYLFGTHHIAPTTMLDSVKGLKEALKEVEAVGGEIDMSVMSDPSAQMAIMQWGMAPQDSLLTMVLTPSQADSVNVVFKQLSGGQLDNAVEQMAMLKPALISTQLAMLESLQAFPDFDQSQQLDATVQQLGREAGKELVAMETLDQQMGFLMGNPISEQVDDLMSVVRDSQSGKNTENAKKLADAYMAQDLDAVAALMFKEDMDEAQMKRLITDRNANWAVKLAEILPDKTLFLAVGCGHLPGPEGLIELLRKAGYTVEPVK